MLQQRKKLIRIFALPIINFVARFLDTYDMAFVVDDA